MKVIKIILVFSLIFLSSHFQKAFTAPPLDMACVQQAREFFFNSGFFTYEQAANRATTFCGGGGSISCIRPTSDWLFKNTRRTNADSFTYAIFFCQFGSDVRCVPPSLEWFKKNSPKTLESNIEDSLKFCAAGGSVDCLDSTRDNLFNVIGQTWEQATINAIDICSPWA
jgi:hypothetical protein